MDASFRPYVRWLLYAAPIWGLVAALHGVSLFIPLNSPGPGADMATAFWQSGERLTERLLDYLHQGRSFSSGMLLLADGFMCGTEVAIILAVCAALIVGRWHWTISMILLAAWGAVTGFFAYGYAVSVGGNWLDMPAYFWKHVGAGLFAWYGTLLLAAVVSLALEWRRRIELRRQPLEALDDE